MVSIVNSVHNSQELIRDQQGRNSLLATYLYWVFCLPDPPQDVQNAGRDKYPSEFNYLHPSLLSYSDCRLSSFTQAHRLWHTQRRVVTAPWVGPQQPLLAICYSSPECAVAATPTSPVHRPLQKILKSITLCLSRYRESPQPKLALKHAQTHYVNTTAWSLSPHYIKYCNRPLDTLTNECINHVQCDGMHVSLSRATIIQAAVCPPMWMQAATSTRQAAPGPPAAR